MKWPNPTQLESLGSQLLPDGFRLAVLSPGDQILDLIHSLKTWYGDIRVGAESYHLEEQFYLDTLGNHKSFVNTDFLPIVLLDSNESICGLVTFWKNPRALYVTSGLGVLAPHVRGKKLAFVGPQLLELIGKAAGAGQIHYYVTLRNIAQQLVAEKMGFSLAGINPAWDRDATNEKESKRIYEAIYAKVLVPESEIEIPEEEHLSDAVKSLFGHLYPTLNLKK